MTESFWNYLMRITGNASGVAISRAAEVDAGNVSRWKTGKVKPSAESVVKIARRWGKPPVEALVVAGYLSSTEAAEVIEVHTGLAALTDGDLITEIEQRLEGLRYALEVATKQAAQTETVEVEKMNEPSADNPGLKGLRTGTYTSAQDSAVSGDEDGDHDQTLSGE